MDTIFAYTTIVYTALFLSMGIILLTARVPRGKQFTPYRTSRRIFACAYLLLGLTGIIDFIFAPSINVGLTDFIFTSFNSKRNFITIYNIAIVSIGHAWLNTYAYLLLQEPSEKNRRNFLRYAIFVLPVVTLAGGAMTFFPSTYGFASFAIGAVYAGQIVWTISVCRKEYLANVRAMENYYDGTLRFSWMNNALNMTLALALLNLINFYIVGMSLPVRIATTVFYVYFAIRILDYMHVFIYVEESRKEENAAKIAEMENRPEIEEILKNSCHKEKLIPLIAQWYDSKCFCRNSLTIKDVAAEIGTNHTYLSVYLNKELGCSFQQWLNTLRIEESKVLLKKYPYKSAEEIGKMVGITQSYNFSRWFRQITGMSPQQWRKQ